MITTFTEQDRAFGRDILPRVSRTFALSIELLPEDLRLPVRIGYLLCRIVDTIEDEPDLPQPRREALFDRFDALLSDDHLDPTPFESAARSASIGAGSHDAELCLQAGAVFRGFRAIPAAQREAMRPAIAEMSRGMRLYTRRWAEAGRLHLTDLDDLERYCYYVAGTVGELLTALFELHADVDDPDTLADIRARAVSFGLGLQMVNIVKDVAGDLQRDVCYLPESLSDRHRVPLDRLLEPAMRPRGLALIHDVCERARHHLQSAEAYTLLWPATPAGLDVRLFCAVPLALAIGTLKTVEESADTLRPGVTPKLPRETVMRVLQQTRDAVRSDDALRALFHDMHRVEVF